MNNPEKPQKPEKPYPDYPLYAHSNGQWAKRIKNKLHYFGPWNDPQGAVDEYNRVRDDLYAGRKPSPKGYEVSLKYACNAFVTAKKRSALAGEILMDTVEEYRRTCGQILESIGKERDVNSLGPADFGKLREDLVRQFAATTVKNETTRAKVFFKWLFESGHCANPLPYRDGLRPPSARLMRREKARQKGKKRFTREEILLLIDKAGGWKKPAIWLGINCGMGNRDLCELRWENVDLAGGWLDFPRPKTYIERRAKLWPETIAALQAWQEASPSSEFVCCYDDGSQIGQGRTQNNPIAHRFRDIMTAAKIDVDEAGEPLKDRAGRGFYALRHTFQTEADGCKDQVAIRYVMGHADHSISGVYRQGVEDERLVAVAERVRGWLLAVGKKPK